MVKRIICVTDGDGVAVKAVTAATRALGLGCVLQSAGNPTDCTYDQLLENVMNSQYEVTVILFDDAGQPYEGRGEEYMIRLTYEHEIKIIGALAVASAERSGDWTKVDISIDRYKHLSEWGVDKEGFPDIEENRIHGDTVYSLDQLQIPYIVGIGDLGKMGGRDDPKRGSPVTQTALQLILKRGDTNVKNDRALRENVNTKYKKE
ncbi:stage V sporulation protein AE [Geomicrobium halophilum]|uniref:Stage V sporulation protein AE n=1 Tax=Geomicrobium halophilum TaxID=549000 RepID=A0A841PJD2_9BACL|nr:stage V sporulation protein AE [Geomicrobium halophilum]MBB6448977.1 stage V sporulation protein AE [Geomicrobium halophilum]